MTFKEQLKKLIESRLTTQSKIAQAIGMSRPTWQYKIDRDRFAREELNRIATILHLSDEDFLNLIKCEETK